jgi:hypothetical protein
MFRGSPFKGSNRLAKDELPVVHDIRERREDLLPDRNVLTRKIQHRNGIGCCRWSHRRSFQFRCFQFRHMLSLPTGRSSSCQYAQVLGVIFLGDDAFVERSKF